MLCSDVVININGIEFLAEAEYYAGWSIPAVTNLEPERCSEASGEELTVSSLHLLVDVCGIQTKHDIYFLIDILIDDIREQLNDE